jgi:hypothetical protein
MEPTNLTCGQCGKSWKLIKAGSGTITCPHCKAPLNPGTTEPTAEPQVAHVPPVATEPTPAPPPIPPLTGLSAPSLSDLADADDPGLRVDYGERDEKPRSGRNPLTRVILILVLLFVLAPVALFILLLVVCAVIMAAR